MLEIIFAVKAWRNGWRWRALIPVAFGNLILLTLLVADAEPGLIVIAMVAELGILGWMAFVKPEPARSSVPLIAEKSLTIAGR